MTFFGDVLNNMDRLPEEVPRKDLIKEA